MQKTDPQRIVIEKELQNILLYSKENTVQARPGRKCVDGRYLPNQATGMIARPGGDCGYVMVLMAVNKKKKLGLTPEECFNAVYKIVAGKLHGVFCMHTDHHADPDIREPYRVHHHNSIGCGHLVKAATDVLSQEYDVDSKDVQEFIRYARGVADISDTVQMVNLDGEHRESGVLVINSDTYTINAENAELKRMYFIYDEKRDHDFMKKLVNEMAIEGVTYADMQEESDKQLEATLHNLAMGLPMYRIEFNGREPCVTFSGFVGGRRGAEDMLILKKIDKSQLYTSLQANQVNKVAPEKI